jgi:hypothetical protein
MVVPEGGGGTIVQNDHGDGTVRVQLIVDNLPNETGTSTPERIEVSGITQDPVLPRSVNARERLVNEFHEQTFILQLQIFDTEATMLFAQLESVPGHQTL